MSDSEELLRCNKIYGFFYHGVFFVNILCHVVRLLIMGNDFFTLCAEDKDVVIPHQLMDFHVGAVLRT